MGRLITVATCSLNQWALDFEGNTIRIIESIRKAKAAGARLRVGPELEICGYGCQDHLLEADIFLHSWQALAKIISDPDCQECVLDIGMPVRHRNVRYNCRVLAYNSRILLIRPKMALAADGNYYESRWFTPWQKGFQTETYYLESVVRSVTSQSTVPFGVAALSTLETAVIPEVCEELFLPNAPHIPFGLNGVEVFCNSSGSHWSLRKLQTRVSLILEATRQNGGIYLYANQQGCDGDRLYYDGCAMVIVNGRVVAQGSQFSLSDCEVVVATVDLEDVRSFRCSPSRGLEGSKQAEIPRVEVDTYLSNADKTGPEGPKPSTEIPIHYHTAAEEIELAPAAYLWDYLRRVPGTAGFFLALSGGIDSATSATLVFSMCRLVYSAISSETTSSATRSQVLNDCRRVCAEADDWIPKDAQDICARVLVTAYMGTVNSSKETQQRAADLARDIGAYHIDLKIDAIVSALTKMFTAATSFTPRFKVHGGSGAENLALQNVQARIRMVVAYVFAQLMPTVRQRPGGGSLLVLGSCNVDEQLRGYLTKYDCSSADINPIGGISKTDLRMFLRHACESFPLPILKDFLDATPTAELEPITETYVQSDEADMGFTYDELSVFGRLRKASKLGPYGMLEKLLPLWSAPPPDPETIVTGDKKPGSDAQYVHTIHGRSMSPEDIYTKVRSFFWYQAANRHKQTVITPSLHAEEYSPDDNRFDQRPFVYPPFTWQYRAMEKLVEMWGGKIEKKS